MDINKVNISNLKVEDSNLKTIIQGQEAKVIIALIIMILIMCSEKEQKGNSHNQINKIALINHQAIKNDLSLPIV